MKCVKITWKGKTYTPPSWSVIIFNEKNNYYRPITQRTLSKNTKNTAKSTVIETPRRLFDYENDDEGLSNRTQNSVRLERLVLQTSTKDSQDIGSSQDFLINPRKHAQPPAASRLPTMTTEDRSPDVLIDVWEIAEHPRRIYAEAVQDLLQIWKPIPEPKKYAIHKLALHRDGQSTFNRQAMKKPLSDLWPRIKRRPSSKTAKAAMN